MIQRDYSLVAGHLGCTYAYGHREAATVADRRTVTGPSHRDLSAVTCTRQNVRQMLAGMLLPAPVEDVEDENKREVGLNLERVLWHDGVGVCYGVSGPFPEHVTAL